MKRRSRRSKRVGKLTYPHLYEQEYRRELIGVAKATQRAVLEVVVPMLGQLRSEEGIMDSANSSLESMQVRVIGRVISHYPKRTVVRIAEDYGHKVVLFQKRQLQQKVSKALGTGFFISPELDAIKTADIMEQFVTANVDLIESIPKEYYANVKKRVLQNIRGGMRVEDLAKDLEERAHVPESRAQLIARDQTGKLYGALNRERQKAAGIERYVWRTVGDNRVRETHAELEGEEFEWGDPPVTNDEGETNDPGEDYQCRCTAEPILE